jgi:AraC-like DNA-binding protein
LSGTRTYFQAANLTGPLSIKAVFSGSAIWESNRRQYVIRENSFLVINRDQMYDFLIDSARPSTTLSVFFQHGFVEQVFRVLTESETVLLDSPDVTLPKVIIFQQRLEPEPSGVLAALRSMRVVSAECEISRLALEERFLLLAGTLLRELSHTQKAAFRISSVRASTRDELLRRVLRGRDFLLSKMDESVTVTDAAQAANLSKYHFLRTFRLAFGATPHQFLMTQRLTRARTLLYRGEHSVTEVCLESGFQSLGSFSALFRRRFGVSPEQIQRARRADVPVSYA